MPPPTVAKPRVEDDDSDSDDDELRRELATAAARERARNPHAEDGRAKPTRTSVKRELLADSTSDEDDGPTPNSTSAALSINAAYARKYEEVKQRREMQQLTQKYGTGDADGDSDDDDDEDAVLLTEEQEVNFAKALLAVRTAALKPSADDAACALREARFFPPVEEQVAQNTAVYERAMAQRRANAARRFTLADEYRRALTHADKDDTAAATTESDGRRRVQPQSAEEGRLREAFLQSVRHTDLDVVRAEPTTTTTPKEEESEKRRLLETAFDVAPTSTSTEDEAFIRDYFVKELWRPEKGSDALATLNPTQLAQEEAAEQFYTDAEAWERDYESRKYHHEDADATIQSFARPIGAAADGLLRKHDTTRKDARTRRHERHVAAQARRVEELKRLKHLHRRDLDHRRALIAAVAGLEEKESAVQSVWSEKALDADYDPATFRAKMAALFDDAYYNDAAVEADEMAYFENADGDEDVPVPEENDNADDATLRELLYPTHVESDLTTTTTVTKRPNVDTLRAELRAQELAYDQLHEDEVLGSGPNAVRARFRYRDVPAADFGLTVEEILTRDDRQLNMLAPLSHYAAYATASTTAAATAAVARRRGRFRELDPSRPSRRYGELSRTIVLDPQSMTEEEGNAIAARLRKRLREEDGAEDTTRRRRRGGAATREKRE